ncbi:MULTISPECIES: class 1 fructose-bisphosphatase [Candidatus Ichthyocystis]|uniref:Fructose-1,6-bisphosphatase class 1 n=1 Tax=Candidatus Ichthyocystis hellenicum TaxID=1561003 RepID=A0A0S4M4H1_9BURK|nr:MULTISPECIES: class 1 fructose-bisphosphatase [Ichthyocystis]CUT17610.1 Fructose-1,6-bisphosphatase [Candidatus Ichthyocystis hellenicum]
MDLFSFLQLDDFPTELLSLISHIVDVSIDVSQVLSTGVNPCNNEVGELNVHGDVKKSMDMYAHERFFEIIPKCPYLLGIASEESVHPIFQSSPTIESKYLLAVDPLDGSSNLDMNISVGTIFSIFVNDSHEKLSDEVFLKTGSSQLVSGYFIYGPMTQLVLTWGKGTHIFTLDKSHRVYRLYKRSITIPAMTSEFSINLSNLRFWSPPVQKYVTSCLEGEVGPRQRNFNMRWVASMVADVHRLLMRGGVFLYPSDSREKTKHGRLRLLYEVNPISWIVEQAGGLTTDGYVSSLLDVVPHSLHQRVSTILGSLEEVLYIKSIFNE